MKKRLISGIILIVYCLILIKIMVFKDIPMIRVGHLMLNFGGTDANGHANFIPFKTILWYLGGNNGFLIAFINLVGNIVLLVPAGFLIPFIWRNATWKKTLVFAIAAGLIIETLQVLLHVGIFDIDDVILNALGVMIGYWKCLILVQWIRQKKYSYIVCSALLGIGIIVGVYYGMFYQNGMPAGPTDQRAAVAGADLCGGTGGIGDIVSVGETTFSITRHSDGSTQVVTLTNRSVIKDSTGSITPSELKTGESVTLVGGPSPDGSFAADTVLVCSVRS